MPKTIDSDFQTAVEREKHRIETLNLGAKNGSTTQLATTEAAKGRRQDALERRLNQLRTAMGDESRAQQTGQQNRPEVAASTPALASNSGSGLEPPRAPSSQVPSKKPVAWLVAALFPTLAVAGTVWWTARGNQIRPNMPPVAIASVSAPVTPPAPTPVAAEKPSAPAAPQARFGDVAASTTPVAVVPGAAEASPPPQASSAADNAEDQALAVLEGWRSAWSGRDADAYLSHYSPEFAPANGQSRAAWAVSRRDNFAGKKSIHVQVREPDVKRLNERQIRLAFLQDYASGSYNERARPKALLLVREGATWRIAGEWQGTLQVPSSMVH